METVAIRAVIKYLCKEGKCPPRKSMKTSWIHLGRSLLPIALWKKWAAEFKRDRESFGDDERLGRLK
jgi:hypothetical protein